MKFGLGLGGVNSHFFEAVAVAGDEAGYESVWLPEHLVFPVHMTSSPVPGEEHPPVPPQTPVFDAFAYLSFLAGRTQRIRLGTHVYNLGLRHPFVAARAITTLDIVSGGRAVVGIGASWLRQEWEAVGLDFSTRGRRLDESLQVCTRLWTEPEIEHHGEFFSFAPVMFEPKPIQQPRPPILIGGESDAALRRTARLGDGWIGMGHTYESAAAQIAKLREWWSDEGRDGEPEIVIGGRVQSRDDVKRWEDVGVTRMIVIPWSRSREALDGLAAFADVVGIS